MKKTVIILAISTFAATSAQGLSVGRKTCADAAVVGNIVEQTYESVADDDPGFIVMEGILHINLDVRRVRYGRISLGSMRVLAVAHTYFDDKTVHYFYLHRRADKSWWIADCRNR